VSAHGEPPLPPDARRELLAEERRSLGFLVGFMSRWPNFRSYVALLLLGQAVAVCDSLGCDVEGWLAELRRQEPRPDVLVPPRSS
jgi:hypothetical protein